MFDELLVVTLTREIAALTARCERAEKERDEALKYGAREDAMALSFVTHKCGHNDYWKTYDGKGCMACRAEVAERYCDGNQFRSDYPNATAMRKALELTEADAKVLAEECRAWREELSVHDRATSQGVMEVRTATDATGALARWSPKGGAHG